MELNLGAKGHKPQREGVIPSAMRGWAGPMPGVGAGACSQRENPEERRFYGAGRDRQMRRSDGSKARGVAGRCGLTGPCEEPVSGRCG